MAPFLMAAAIAAASVAPGPPNARPAMWVVNDADTIIYLFGTFHALDGKSAWFNDEVETAFVASDELVLETIVPGIPQPEPARPIAIPGDVPTFAVAPNASFLASTRLAISAGRARGMEADNGADMVLRRAAELTGKPVEGLETFDFQLNMFGRIPQQPGQSHGSVQDVSSAGNLAIVMGQLQAAWNRGDPEIFATMLDQMRTYSPESYEIMFTQRNSSWASWIARRLEKPGTVFVAVGTGHLAGPHSIQNKLAQLGVRSARIN